MTDKSRVRSIDEYIEASPPAVRPILQQIRSTIAASVPNASEAISYQMPAFKNKRVFIYFAAFRQHIGIYPPLTASSTLQDQLAPYRGPKGNLKFPLDQAMPYALIAELAAALSRQYG